MTAAKTHTAGPHKMIKIPSNDIISRELVSKINAEHEKSHRLTVAKLNTVSKPYKQDYKSKLMTEKYSLLPINPQQLTPAQTALQRLSEKHPDFEIQAVREKAGFRVSSGSNGLLRPILSTNHAKWYREINVKGM